MMLKLTQFTRTPASRFMVCPRCGYQMFWTKRFNWQCGPACDGAYRRHQMQDSPQIPNPCSLDEPCLLVKSMS